MQHFKYFKRLLFICLLGAVIPVQAQVQRQPGFQPQVFALTNATVTTRPGTTIKNATVLVRDGLIEAVGTDLTVPGDAEVVDCQGMHVYPGFIDAASAELLDKDIKHPKPEERKVDFGRYALAATRPDNRNYLSPEFLANRAITSRKNNFSDYQKAGFTAVHVLPLGKIASGQGTLISTSELPVREATLLETTLGSFRLYAPHGDVYPTTLMGAVAHLRQSFLDTRHYEQHWDIYRDKEAFVKRPPTDVTYVALLETLHGKQIPVFAADSRDQILRALDFCQEVKIKPVILGAAEAHLCLDRLKKDSQGVICKLDFADKPKIKEESKSEKLTTEFSEPQRVQQEKIRLWQQRIQGLTQLAESGIPVAFTSEKLKQHISDVVPQLRVAVKAGFSADEALRSLTVDAAKILGIDQRLGTIEKGKLAHLVVMSHPWEEDDSKVRYLFVDGLKLDFTEKEKEKKQEPTKTPTEKKEQPVKVDLAGDWGVEIESAQGKVIGELKLAQDRSELRGSFSSEKGNGKVTAGKIEKDKLTITVAIGAGEHSIELQFNGTLGVEKQPQKLSGKLKSAFGTETSWSAVRKTPQSDSAPDNPIQLSLEGMGGDDLDFSPAESEVLIAEKPKHTSSEGADISRHQFQTELESDRISRHPLTDGNLLLKNGTVITVTGKTFSKASVLVKNGKVAAIGTDLKVPGGTTEIDVTGMYVMPGIIDTHSHIMITEGINESSQSIVPEVRVRDVVNTADPSEYRALAGGVTTARLFHGSANVIGGQDAVVKLKHGKTAREHVLHDAPQGVKFALGENVKFRTSRFPNTRMGVEATLQRAFLEAVDYRRQWQQYERAKKTDPDLKLVPPRRDLRLEALADIVNHEKFIHSHCYRADEILMLLRVASNLGVRVWSLQHVLEGYKIAPEILAHGASCSTFSDWWAYKIEAFDAVPHNAALLNEAGINTVIKSDDWELIRHLYLEAAKTVRYGNLSFGDALQTITINPARELGLDQQIGSIEIGKDGDFAIFNGHPLNAYSRCEMTIIEGEVYFDRLKQPTAMSEAAEKRSAHSRTVIVEQEDLPLKLPASNVNEFAITGATLHPIDRKSIPGGILIVRNQKIEYVGPAKPLPKGLPQVDAQGLHVYPGMIDTGTTLGLTEIDKVKETRDYSESGDLQPDLRTGVAINPDSELFPVARAGGITTVLVCPQSGLIAGQSSIVQTAGWTAPEMVMQLEAGLQINWSIKKDRQEELKEFFKQARLYQKLKSQTKADEVRRPVTDPRYEALMPYLDGKKPVLIEANSREAIAGALLFAEEQKLKMIIAGGADAWKLTKELKERKVPVIVGPVMHRPEESYDPFDAPYTNPARLYDAGVPFCIRSNSAWNSRNTPFEAAMAVAYGLPEEAAIRSVTLSAAEILGIEELVGSLTKGKLANLIISDGSPLQQTSHIKAVCVGGQIMPPESKQTRLYKRYRQRLQEFQKSSGDKAVPLPLETQKTDALKKPANTK
ncbi:amidohydrolase family protein [Gimesia chilikensis]|uniref:amidohydrolase family protein n=1 Tax=Gimesia chilikensis TaxID=2605989 RepID=UPI00118941FC|nr:amidohydrolase family protein [Gimesia chilikensis]MCR9230282.1 amidohydrolase family protein [bacterium]QDT84995.1 D-phenylhydantoinase [Gimesia chilikensis]